MDSYIGEIKFYPYHMYTPERWLLCDGRSYSIREYTALFAVIENTFGGDGRNSFNVPDLQGRAIVGVGQGPGLSPYRLGGAEGANAVALTRASQLPAHTHNVTVEYLPYKQEPTAYGPKPSADKSYPSRYWYNTSSAGSVPTYAAFSKPATEPPADPTQLASSTVGPLAGESKPHENRQPFIVLRACICYDGIFPPRPD